MDFKTTVNKPIQIDTCYDFLIRAIRMRTKKQTNTNTILVGCFSVTPSSAIRASRNKIVTSRAIRIIFMEGKTRRRMLNTSGVQYEPLLESQYRQH